MRFRWWLTISRNRHNPAVMLSFLRQPVPGGTTFSGKAALPSCTAGCGETGLLGTGMSRSRFW
ncbi:hypothetical protein OpiT1DRAFT_03249 [Opitutaceae bacterium TAV1]|nr:hypothetical protein OpiT1DRAFT_03249 [Opitutaceae bacterium TAV1]